MAVQKTLSPTANKLTFQFDQKASFKLDGKKIDLAKATDQLTFVGKNGQEKTVKGFQGKDGLFYALREDKSGNGYHINVYGEPAALGKQQFSVRGGDVSKARFDGVRYFKNDASSADFTIEKGLANKVDDFAKAFGLSRRDAGHSLSVGSSATPRTTRSAKQDEEELLKGLTEAKSKAKGEEKRRLSVLGPPPEPLDLAAINHIDAQSRPRSMSVGAPKRPPDSARPAGQPVSQQGDSKAADGTAGLSSSSPLQGSQAAINGSTTDDSSSMASTQGSANRDGGIRTTAEDLSDEIGDTQPSLADTIFTARGLQILPTLSGEKNLLAALSGSVGGGNSLGAEGADAQSQLLKNKLDNLLNVSKESARGGPDAIDGLLGGQDRYVLQRLGQKLDPSVLVDAIGPDLDFEDIENRAEDGLLKLAAMAHNRSVVTIDDNSARIFSPDGNSTEFSSENQLSAFNEKFDGLKFPIVLTKSGTDWQAVGPALRSLSDDT